MIILSERVSINRLLKMIGIIIIKLVKNLYLFYNIKEKKLNLLHQLMIYLKNTYVILLIYNFKWY